MRLTSLSIVVLFIVLTAVVDSADSTRITCKTSRCDVNCSLGATCLFGAKMPSGASGACWSKSRGRTGFSQLCCTPSQLPMGTNVPANASGVFLGMDMWDPDLVMFLLIQNFSRSDRGTYRCVFEGQEHLRVTAQPWSVEFLAHPLPQEDSTTWATSRTLAPTAPTTVSTPTPLEREVLTLEPVHSIGASSSSHPGGVVVLAVLLISAAVGALWFLIRSRATSPTAAARSPELTVFPLDFTDAEADP